MTPEFIVGHRIQSPFSEPNLLCGNPWKVTRVATREDALTSPQHIRWRYFPPNLDLESHSHPKAFLIGLIMDPVTSYNPSPPFTSRGAIEEASLRFKKQRCVPRLPPSTIPP
jgi:hypothetical protein